MSTGCDAHLNALASATLGHLLLVLLGDLGSLTADLLGANGGGVQGQFEVPGERVGLSRRARRRSTVGAERDR